MNTWYPSRYGVDDQAGALNEIAPDAVVSAARLVHTGRVFDLAHVLHAEVPAFPGRTYTQVLHPDQEPVGTNQVHWVVEQITATQQMGTHVDALNQIGRIGCGHSLPGLAAVESDVRIAARSRSRRASCLKRRRDHVVRVLRVDGNGNLSGIVC